MHTMGCSVGVDVGMLRLAGCCLCRGGCSRGCAGGIFGGGWFVLSSPAGCLGWDLILNCANS